MYVYIDDTNMYISMYRLHYLYVEFSLFLGLSLALALFIDIQTSVWTVQNSPWLHNVVAAYVNLNSWRGTQERYSVYRRGRKLKMENEEWWCVVYLKPVEQTLYSVAVPIKKRELRAT